MVQVSSITGALQPLLGDVQLPYSFDLVNPGQNLEGGDLGDNLVGLGFPVKDDVKDKTSLCSYSRNGSIWGGATHPPLYRGWRHEHCFVCQ